MNIEFLGKFYDNHSLSIVNRNIVLGLYDKGIKVKITPLDSYNPKYKLTKNTVSILKELENTAIPSVDIQLRHTYPPIWKWPLDKKTKVVFIQPWEFPKAPFEWQYKFEQFADALIVPSNFCANIFASAGLNPENLFVVPNGYNKNIFNNNKDNVDVSSLNIDKNKFNFVYVGNAQWRKGLDLLLNAWSSVFSKSDNARLIIKDNPQVYGETNILNEIVKLQYKNHCAEIIYLDQNLTDEEMASIYKSSKVVVHPYRAEGFGMHIQEAVASGCLPIVSANGPTDDFITDDGGIKLPTITKHINIQDPGIFAMKPGDSATFMGSHTFINEPSLEHLKQALGYVYHAHNKEAILSKYSNNKLNDWESVCNHYISVFNSILSRESAPQRYL